MELARLGFLPQQDSLVEKFMNFDMDYDKQDREFVISIPTEALVFEQEEDILKLDLGFEFYIYDEETGHKEKLEHDERFETTEENILNREEVVFTIPKDLGPGKYFIDVIITVMPDVGKVRKIFNIKTD
jgi:hypothetical protein